MKSQLKFLITAGLGIDTSDIPLMLSAAIQAEGHDVRIFPLGEDGSALETVLQKQGRIETRDYGRAVGRRLERSLSVYRPDVLFLYGSNPGLAALTLSSLKRRFGLTLILWEGNGRFWGHGQAESMKVYDHVFVLDSYLIPLLRGPAGVKSVQFLSPGCDPEIHHPCAPSDPDAKRLLCDISFVGSAYPERMQVFERLFQQGITSMKLWGWGWRNSAMLRGCSSDRAVYGLLKSRIYAHSKIVVHLQGRHIQIDGISCRPFEALACGALCISEHKPDVEKCLVPDREIVVFRTEDELVEKVRYYLAQDEQRRLIAEAGRKKVLAEYTYRHVARRILAVMRC